ncbi:Oxaloacetate decarboxylase, gamma chain [Posidoniimonas polymericola]|uniref:Oxaloacetate decarboxylase, gamma chain n=1 Tax=Posidoniimonas polymericola TaxID=2528002 RepID=A0A5C5YQR1_9BACT|nr:OadG family transporter subunit [Posidoniimonas polymericola]TWT77203.1 Oxaloacetate decarboxylase, gamma chain [Posidoniimonas polymericola]
MALLLPILAEASGWQGIVEGRGLAISVTGMLIVFVALATISTFIAMLPKLLALIEPIFPESAGHHHASPAAPQAPAPTAVPATVVAVAGSLPAAGPAPAQQDDGAVIAAIGYAVHASSSAGKGAKA